MDSDEDREDEDYQPFAYSQDIGKAAFSDVLFRIEDEASHTDNPNAPIFHLREYLRGLGYTYYK